MITVIVATNRPNSMSAKLALAYSRELDGLDSDNQVLSLEDLPDDFAFADMYGNRTEKMQQIIDQYIADIEHFVFVVPEYNGGFPGVVKTFIDAIEPRHWHGKWACLVGLSSGRSGNLRGVDQLGNVLNYLQVHVHYRKPKFSSVETLFKDGVLLEEPSALLSSQAKEFVELVRRTR